MGWPQTVHVSLVLHAMASCALLGSASILLYMKGAEKLKKIVCGVFVPPMRGIRPGTQVQFNSTLMSLAPIKIVCLGHRPPRTIILYCIPPGEQFVCIVC